jgi:hypothetical protein
MLIKYNRDLLTRSIRVVTAYDLDAGQKRDYLKRRAQGE